MTGFRAQPKIRVRVEFLKNKFFTVRRRIWRVRKNMKILAIARVPCQKKETALELFLFCCDALARDVTDLLQVCNTIFTAYLYSIHHWSCMSLQSTKIYGGACLCQRHILLAPLRPRANAAMQGVKVTENDNCAYLRTP